MPPDELPLDAVRRVTNNYQPQNDTPVIFQLSDGVSLRQCDCRDPRKAMTFDMPLESRRSSDTT